MIDNVMIILALPRLEPVTKEFGVLTGGLLKIMRNIKTEITVQSTRVTCRIRSLALRKLRKKTFNVFSRMKQEKTSNTPAHHARGDHSARKDLPYSSVTKPGTFQNNSKTYIRLLR